MSEQAAPEVMGPVDFSVLAFPGATFDGSIAEELRELVDRDVVSILDLVMVRKGADGNVEVVELADADAGIAAQFEKVDGEILWLLSEQDVAAAGEILEPGTTGVVVVWENAWARRLKLAVDRAGGRLVVHDRLDAEAVADSIAMSPGGH